MSKTKAFWVVRPNGLMCHATDQGTFQKPGKPLCGEEKEHPAKEGQGSTMCPKCASILAKMMTAFAVLVLLVGCVDAEYSTRRDALTAFSECFCVRAVECGGVGTYAECVADFVELGCDVSDCDAPPAASQQSLDRCIGSFDTATCESLTPALCVGVL